MIRPAMAPDAPMVAAIWNPIIRDTAVTFASTEKSVEGLARDFAVKEAEGKVFFVAMADERMLGFATYGQFRGGVGYAHAMEHTVILSPDARGQGVGRALLTAIEDHARIAGAHVMMAGVSAENPEAVGFHAAHGYRQMVVLPQLGRKFGRWMDLILMQKML
ncbi:MAG: GNAT family N-acetyltransferase [Thalassovita sp.]